ncbi:hypothetical protein H8S95_09725 [Pontibacter sp. KCTC 32443]|uniref:hypothetical protein n=1 Tax=Pontibacter TaxID=323449 RepID=UPI00164D66E0|nr:MULTISPECIES: hypothetical protein [Pontibacter]MBC5774338.1 hypothetical protein [Pontibacter sp. KCTC 32443]
MSKRVIFSWILLVVALWLSVGIILFPDWYYAFFFEGFFWDFDFWLGGVRDILRYLINNPVIILFLIVVYFIIQRKVLKFQIPQLNFFTGLKSGSLIVIMSVIVGLLIFWIPSNSSFEYYNIGYIEDSSNKVNASTPLDFIYINKNRVGNLFEQIKPDLVLKEKQLENQLGEEKNIANGDNPILNASYSETNQAKQTETYSASEISDPKKVKALLEHFETINAIRFYQKLELTAEDVKKLETFNNLSQQFQISYDKLAYAKAYDKIVGETISKERSNMKSLTGQVLIQGDFLINISQDKLLLKHNYFHLDENNRISFRVSTLNRNDDMSRTLNDLEQNNKAMSLTVFGKVIRAESIDKVTDIYIDPYAIW